MPSAKELRVLVADDQKSMRELARMCLKGIGVQDIEFVESAEQALDRLKEVQVSREQVIAQRRNIIKKGVYLAGAGALAATTAGSLAAFIPPYVNPFTDGTYQVVWPRRRPPPHGPTTRRARR